MKVNKEIDELTNTELKADEDGFLFEIEDHLYLLKMLNNIVVMLLTITTVMIITNTNIKGFLNLGYQAHFLFYIGLPYIFLEAIKICIYLTKSKKKIRFYVNGIEQDKHYITSSDLNFAYLVKFNSETGGVFRRSSWFVYILMFPIFFYVSFLQSFSRFLYSIYTKKYSIQLDNLILLKHNNRGITIGINFLNESERLKVDSYLRIYFNTNIHSVDKHFIKIPEWRNKNLFKKEIGNNNE